MQHRHFKDILIIGPVQSLQVDCIFALKFSGAVRTNQQYTYQLPEQVLSEVWFKQKNNFHCFTGSNNTMVANTENIRRLNSYLNFKARIKITDGRTFIGTFVCIDKEKNIILAHTEEFRGGTLVHVWFVLVLMVCHS